MSLQRGHEVEVAELSSWGRTSKAVFNFIFFILILSDQNKLKMETNRTQNYLYKLSLSIHQKNVDSTRPAVQSKITPATSRTLELTHARSYNRDLSHLQQHQIDYDNKAIIHRLISITDRGKSTLDRYKEYSKFNEFQRPFRAKNPYRSEKQRRIDLQNQKIYKSILTMKPRIGQMKEWQKYHKNNKSYSRIYSKHRSSERREGGDSRLREIEELQRKIKSTLEEKEEEDRYRLPWLK